MKIKFTLVSLIFFMFLGSILNVHAEKGKDKGGRINFTTTVNTTVTTTCPAGQVLIDSQKNKSGFGTTGTLTCIELDLNFPSINVLGNGYSDNGWTNRNVTLSVSVSDIGTGLKKIWYKVNGTDYVGSSSFDLVFNEEGTYNIIIGAEDLSTHNSLDGSASSVGNITENGYTVKIDKSPMALTLSPDTNYNWRNTKPTISFSIIDKYKGQSIEVRTFSCTGKPANSVWINPVANDGTLVGTCNPELTSCINDSNYNPNTSSCNWKCIDGYTKGVDNLCYKNSVSLTCDNTTLPQGTSIYNINNVLVNETTNIMSYWISPTGVSSDGSFVSNYSALTNTYSPETSSCGYDCRTGYHLDNGKCVNDVSVICCKKDYPLTEPATVGAVIDCSLAINANHVACMYNNLCSDFTKDVLKYWTGTQYDYESEGVSGIDTLSQACGMVNIPNSDGETCNPGYYLVGGGTADQNCERVPTGEWSGQENIKRSCTNKPSNSTYIAHTSSPLTGDENDCPWVCDGDFTKNGNRCDRQNKTSTCDNKPSNTVWNSVSSITQYKNGGNWEPSLTPTYSTTASTSECRFKCASGYGWNGNICNPIVNGACGTSNGTNLYNAPSSNLCSNGTASTVSGIGPWSWSCSGSNGGTNASCSANKKMDGACGTANGTTTSTKPTTNLCSNGTASTVSGSGPWSWSCNGSNGGTNASCSAISSTIINGSQSISAGGDGNGSVIFNGNGTINVSNFCGGAPGVCAGPGIDSIINWGTNIVGNYYIKFQCTSTSRCSAGGDTGGSYIAIGGAGVSAFNVRYNSSASCSCTYTISNNQSDAGAVYGNGTITFDVGAWDG